MSDDIWYFVGAEKEIGFLKDEYVLIENDRNGTILGPLNRINIFVGANNSGKSMLMRRLIVKDGYRLNNDFKESAQLAQKIITTIDEIEFIDPKIKITSGTPADNLSDLKKQIDQLRGRSNSLVINPGNKTVVSGNWLEIDYRSQLMERTRAILEQATIFWNIESQELKQNSQVNQALKLKLGQYFRQFDNQNWLFHLMAIEMALEILVGIVQGDGHKRQHLRSIQGSSVPLKVAKNEELLVELHSQIKTFIRLENEKRISSKKNYIPVLRSTHRLWNQDESNPNPGLFKFSAKKNYHPQLEANVQIYTGQELFHEIIEARNGESTKRKRFEDFETFISNQFFPGKKVDIVAQIVGLSEPEEIQRAIMKQSIHVKIEGDEEREIHKLGDGIQALIMLTFPIFMAEEGSFIFIEEPELNLHPGMQRIFLEVISKNEIIKEKNLTFFMTTHSNHFLDLTITEDAPVSIFTLRKKEVFEKDKPQFEIRNVHGGDKGILDLLGVQNSSVFIGNCSIWIEGITDRKYLRKYLDLYMENTEGAKKYKEDLHYVFFEYSGSNLSHYSFEEGDQPSEEEINALRLNNRIMVIADKDQGKEKKHTFFQNLKLDNFKYRPLKVAREIENLLAKEVVESALPKMFPTLDSQVPDKIRSINWAKKKIDDATYKTDPLYVSLKKVIGNDLFQTHYPKSSKSKTLPSAAKAALCTSACAEGKVTWKNMTQEAKDLTQEVYQFIADSNSF